MIEQDLIYIRANYVSLAALAATRSETEEELRAHVAAKRLPGPAYVLPDGTEMFPRDWLALADQSGGIDHARAEFMRRFIAASNEEGEPAGEESAAEEWTNYLGGMYAVCLREVTPENVFRKERLVRRLTEQLASPAPNDPAWRARLRADVDALDQLERPFAPYDRVRFGGPVTRDRLITAARARYPACFE
ncbi:DUF6058 family natural product biosynthesis protein [Pendulispora rubella]|uniref:DUF6058 family natural product biosynthesis protein n=1 Tax=Pendulispora rubella TaxID=2741070 RepID=A0ABZ2KUF5_9BACT